MTGDAVADVGVDLDKVRFAEPPIVTEAITATVRAAIGPPSPIDVDVDVDALGAFDVTA